MNVESLKSELQQVLDDDLVLRKEFGELKRSLSDYRNQLIMRDEDCKRLQVTIDVLNTKLVVMERDNSSYKIELTSFRELRGSIKEQLDAKQNEIDARLEEIQQLKNDLNTIAAGYEQKIAEMRIEAELQVERLTSEFSSQIHELKSTAHYKETGIKDEFENRLSELSVIWADKEQSILLNHEEQIIALKSNHEKQLADLAKNYEQRLLDNTNQSEDELLAIKAIHQSAISQLVEDYDSRTERLETTYKNENVQLVEKIEQQHRDHTLDFESRLGQIKDEYSTKERELIANYEDQIVELKTISASSNGQISESFLNQINEIKSAHAEEIKSKDADFKQQFEDISNQYEERLSNTLIHSNSQNSKLSDDLAKVVQENEAFKNKINELALFLNTQNDDIISLTTQLSLLQNALNTETNKFAQVSSEFESFKQSSSLSNSEQVNELNSQILNLQSQNSEIVNGLELKINLLEDELKNLSNVFESTTNTLSETEIALELKVEELSNASAQIDSLNAEIAELKQSILDKDLAFDGIKLSIEENFEKQSALKEIEYQKLLAENSNLINEIDIAQDKVEAQSAELEILKSEFEELRVQGIGKAEHFKETLATKNFEITNMEANNAALAEELVQTKAEVNNLREQISNSANDSGFVESLQKLIETLGNEKNTLLAEINRLQQITTSLNLTIEGLSEKIAGYESEITNLKNSPSSEQHDAFVDRLFKQIDALNDQHLVLLSEKEQMAGQLLKMNDVVSELSQQVDNERIDVTDLNNHRKNVILAKNSGGISEKSHMKEQINDLVREIDKCIALLST